MPSFLFPNMSTTLFVRTSCESNTFARQLKHWLLLGKPTVVSVIDIPGDMSLKPCQLSIISFRCLSLYSSCFAMLHYKTLWMTTQKSFKSRYQLIASWPISHAVPLQWLVREASPSLIIKCLTRSHFTNDIFTCIYELLFSLRLPFFTGKTNLPSMWMNPHRPFVLISLSKSSAQTFYERRTAQHSAPRSNVIALSPQAHLPATCCSLL